MNVSSLIPAADTIPVHWGWLWFFLILTFTIHLLLMNAMLGTGIIAFFYTVRRKTPQPAIEKEISKKLPLTIAFTVNMGVPPLLFIQALYGHFFYTSSILMAVYWLSIVMVLMVAYYSAYLYQYKFDISYQLRFFLISLAVVLLLGVGFLFTNNITLMLSPERWSQYFINPRGTLLNLSEVTLVPRYLHFVFASIANGALFLAIFFHVKEKKGDTAAKGKKEIVMKWFTHGLAINIILGLWFLISLPGHVMSLFLGGQFYATLLLIIGFIGVCGALFFGIKRHIPACAGATFFTLIIMVLMRDVLRTAYLKPYFNLSMLRVEPQYMPMVLFIVSLVVGIGVIGYMLNLAARAGKES
jgi:hypothetical protein